MGRKIGLTILIIVVILVVVAAAGLFIFKGKAMPVYGKVIAIPYLEKSPAKVISDIPEKLGNVDTAHYTVGFKISGKGNDNSTSNANTNSSFGLGDSSILQIPEFKLELNYGSDMKTQVNNNEGQAEISGKLALSGTEYSLDLKLIVINNKLYLNAVQLPVIPMFDLSQYQNKWYYYDLKDLDKLQQQLEGQYGQQLGLTNQNTNLSSEQIEKLKNIFTGASIIKLEERLPDEKIEGTDSYHYSIKIDKTGSKNFIKSLFGELANTNLMPNANLNVNSSDLEKDLEGMDQAIDKVNEGKIEIWVGKDDNVLRKFLLAGTYGDKNPIQLEVSLILSKINETVNIQEPTGALPLTEITSQISSQFMGVTNSLTGSQTEEDITKDSDNDSLTDFMEEIYGTDKNNPDTDGDGYLDGQEVQNGYNPKGPGKLSS